MRDDELGLVITFGGESDEANRASEELKRQLLEDADVRITTTKDDPDSQDAGSTLAMIFSSGAVVAIAEGIRAYLTKRPAIGDTITIKTRDGEILANGKAALHLDPVAVVKALKATPAQGHHKKR